MTTILITGATGFLGEYVIRRLLKSRSEIRAFVRPTSDIAWLSKQDVHLFFGDLISEFTILGACPNPKEATFINKIGRASCRERV